jgi:ABC-type nitrate/sulfonate/bicarbonate transport system permease component
VGDLSRSHRDHHRHSRRRAGNPLVGATWARASARLLWQIALPAALPQIITGLQVALPIALIVAIVTEMFMGGYGLGGAMNTASRFADSRGVFAGIVEIAVIGYALVKGMAIVRRRLLLWHQEALAPSTV